ncbi:unnamed protein product [Peniophora sp. CBMAI 1063]|nr:unnamed protein product [Peniophora sp. CBMAI 1063]
MLFQTDRLILRAYTPDDVDRLYEIWSDPEVCELCFSTVAGPMTRDFVVATVLAWLDAPSFFAIIEHKKTGECIGQVGLLRRDIGSDQASLGMTLAPEYSGRGYGTEVLRWLVGFGFRELQLYRIYLHVFEGNAKAIGLYRKIGFIHERTSTERRFVQKRWQAIDLMSILENEWDHGRNCRLEF